ncbi:hypothetical protein CEP54_008484 [Fusarium duplospermum]|uniref:Uncharacterized protein n=1 Tax=Fusarium duplospermum TaxID=1325734 RepID=A0A428PVP0_9HYPO|nr:hypothetical protein CEP54_008484 [Fusarium duplospermum]
MVTAPLDRDQLQEQEERRCRRKATSSTVRTLTLQRSAAPRPDCHVFQVSRAATWLRQNTSDLQKAQTPNTWFDTTGGSFQRDQGRAWPEPPAEKAPPVPAAHTQNTMPPS